MIRSAALVFYCLLLGATATAQSKIDFAKDVEPIFAKHCLDCHGPDELSGGLRVDQRAWLLRGGDSGTATVVPEHPDQSYLLEVLTATGDALRMPPEGAPLEQSEIATLSNWIAQGAHWPGQTAEASSLTESNHWAFQPLPDCDGPSGLSSSMIDRHVAANLTAAGLEFSEPAEPTALLRRASLLVTGLPPTQSEIAAFLADASKAESAYQHAVDRLLASPRYGERWAQHWLDVIRWAETVGFETNAVRPNAWPYRDWVIQAFNEDKPYDRFIFEQLAGDTVGEDAALGFLVAGPANLPGQIGRDEEAMRQARQDELDEVIRTVSQSLMALTIGCARCHNHKFDPILQRDYYAMQAIFSGLQYGERRHRGETNDKWTRSVPAAREQLRALEADRDVLREQLQLLPPIDAPHEDRFEACRMQKVRMEILNTCTGGSASLYEFEAWTAGKESNSRNVAAASSGATVAASSFALANQTRHFDNLIDGDRDRRQAFPWQAATSGEAWLEIEFAQPERIDRIVLDHGSSIVADYRIRLLDIGADGAEQWRTVVDSRRRWLREEDTRNAADVTLIGADGQPIGQGEVKAVVDLNAQLRRARAKLAKLQRGPQVFAAKFIPQPNPTWLLGRGDPMNRREEVAPAIPTLFGDLELDSSTPDVQRRLALARHLTHDGHPLTSRVFVNRVWQHYFGNGLVDTPSDFGKMGSPPSHPKLLDELAAGFVADGWSMKSLHRTILLSRTFQQASWPNRHALAIDADSRLLWRFPPRRLEAEAIRDSILQTSGNLNLVSGGSGFNLFKQRGGLADYTPLQTFEPEGWRRMIYAHKIRMQAVEVFGAFDCPDAGQMKPKRTRSITPIQSLGLLNSPFVLRQAEAFASRVEHDVGDCAEAQVRRAFDIALGRAATPTEVNSLEPFVASEGLMQLCRVLFNSSEFLYIR